MLFFFLDFCISYSSSYFALIFLQFFGDDLIGEMSQSIFANPSVPDKSRLPRPSNNPTDARHVFLAFTFSFDIIITCLRCPPHMLWTIILYFNFSSSPFRN